jgi:hypothetical protein
MTEVSTQTNPSDSTAINSAVESAADKAAAVGRDMQKTAIDLANSSTDALKQHVSQLADAAKGIAADAGTRLQAKVAERQGAGADYVNTLADTMRRAAGEFDAEVPLAGTYIRKAADQVDNAAEAWRSGNLNDLVRGAQSFAKNQPTAFLGLAVLAGFGVVRFLKSSSSTTGSGEVDNAAPREFEDRSFHPDPRH